MKLGLKITMVGSLCILLLSFTVDRSEWSIFNEKNSAVPGNQVNSIQFDENNNLWLGTDQGMASFEGNKATHHYMDKLDLTNKTINRIAIKDELIAVATTEGLIIYQKDHRYHYSIENSKLKHNWIHDVEIDNSGVVWLSAGDKGIYKLEKNKLRFPKRLNKTIGYSVIYDIHFGANGDLYLATENKGLIVVNESIQHYHKMNSGIGSNWINKVVTDARGTIWLGTENGLVSFNGKQWLNFNTNNSDIPNNYVSDVEVNGNSVWVATANGLASFNQKKWEIMTTYNSPLPHDYVKTLSKDLHGNLAIGTMDGGVAMFKEKGVIFDSEINTRSNWLVTQD